MKTSAFYALAATQLVAGHATFQSFVIGGVDQGQHKAVRTPANANNPIYDVTSPLMVCNGGKATTDTIEVAAGSAVTMQWHHNDPVSTGDADEPIASSHKGPVMVYIAPAESDGAGAVWVKLSEDGFENGKWGVDNFIANKGQITVTLPNLVAGDYLIRPEIIALHEASAVGKAQFYNGCGQIKVTGSGSVSLPAGVDMTKAYSATEPGVQANIYSGLTSYKIPGPAVFDGASGTTPTKPSASSVAPAPSTTVIVAPSPTKEAVPTASSTAAPSPGNGSTLPTTFTIKEFIAWLETTTGTAAVKRFARSLNRGHARQFL